MEDEPDIGRDQEIADQILLNHHVGETEAQQSNLSDSVGQSEDYDEEASQLSPEIDTELLRKYIAHAQQNCFPELTEQAKHLIKEFYVDMRSNVDEGDALLTITARKLEAIVRLAEASARVRLSDTVEAEDAERAVDIVRSCLQDIGVDPETGQFDTDVVETKTSTKQRERSKNIKDLISEIAEEFEKGAPVSEILDRSDQIGIDASTAEDEINKLRAKGEVYEPVDDHLRTT